MEQWIFVAGMIRSGTTLAMTLLNFHPHCRILSETGLPLNLWRAVCPPPDEASLEPAHAEFWRDGDERHLVLWNLTRLRLHASPEEIVRAICRAVRSLLPPFALFGDKLPDYCLHWELLRRLFPECRIVICDRDIEATVASVLRQPWNSLTPDEVRSWLLMNRSSALRCPDALWMKLEELEADPQGEITRLLAYAGLDAKWYDWQAAIDQVKSGRVS